MTIIMVTMPGRGPYRLVYAPSVREHLRAIRRNFHPEIKAEIEANLLFEPDVPTSNRKRLSPRVALDVEWEFRCGLGNRYRVFYNVDEKRGQVEILAIGVKRGSRLTIGREEVKL
jgi:mRNA-degrading endonuclease RelE of RelBE toxin-antitoxin system